jgi:hypothetical protein
MATTLTLAIRTVRIRAGRRYVRAAAAAQTMAIIIVISVIVASASIFHFNCGCLEDAVRFVECLPLSVG